MPALRTPLGTDKAAQFFIAFLLVAVLVPSFAVRGSTPATDVPWPALFSAFGRSVLVAGLATLGALALGIPAAWRLCGRSGSRTFWLALTVLPLALPVSVAVSGYVGFFAPAGAASRFKVSIPGFDEGRGWLFSPLGASLVLAATLWPVVALQLWPALRSTSRESWDAARMNLTPLRAFWRTVLPQIRREVLCAALLVFLLAASDFSVCSLLLVRTLTTEVHDFLMLAQPHRAAWAALPLLLIVLGGVVALGKLERPRALNAENPFDAAPGWTGGIVAFGVVLGFVLPMFACFLQWKHGGKPMSSVFTAGSDALGLSIRLALAAAMLATFLTGARVALWPDVSARSISHSALLLLCVPSSFLGAGLLAIQFSVVVDPARVHIWGTLILTLGYVLRFLYVPLRLVEEGLSAIPQDVIEAARLSSPSRFSLATQISLPLAGVHLLCGAVLVFLFALNEIALPSKLAPPGTQPATVWLFQQQHLGYDEAVFGLSLLLGSVAAAAVILGAVAMHMLRRRK